MHNNLTRTILVIEDYRDTRALLSSLLRAKGYKVIERADGRERLAAGNRVAPDLILMDLAMPRMDGVEAAGQLRQRNSSRERPSLRSRLTERLKLSRDALERVAPSIS